MGKSLTGKIAVVTGGSTGIGFATARAFRDEGARVFVTGRRKDALDAATAELGPAVTGVVCDVSVPADLDAFYGTVRDQAGRIDVLVANAGIGVAAPFGEVTEELIDSVFAVNVKGTIFTLQQALPLLSSNASVILTGSTASTRPTQGSRSTGRRRPPSATSPVAGPTARARTASGSTSCPRAGRAPRSAGAGPARGSPAGRRRDPSRPARRTRRDRRPDDVPRLGRVELRQWCRVLRRRWLRAGVTRTPSRPLFDTPRRRVEEGAHVRPVWLIRARVTCFFGWFCRYSGGRGCDQGHVGGIGASVLVRTG